MRWSLSSAGSLYLGLPVYAAVALRLMPGEVDASWLADATVSTQLWLGSGPARSGVGVAGDPRYLDRRHCRVPVGTNCRPTQAGPNAQPKQDRRGRRWRVDCFGRRWRARLSRFRSRQLVARFVRWRNHRAGRAVGRPGGVISEAAGGRQRQRLSHPRTRGSARSHRCAPLCFSARASRSPLASTG